MKHITTAEKSLLVGDEAADLLLEYAAALARVDSADTVTLTAFGDDGDPVEVTFLLNNGTSILVETSASPAPEPDNAEVVEYMRVRLERIVSPPYAQPVEEPAGAESWEF
jgi:hypothetical protein